MEVKHFWSDGGWKSRKLWFSFYATGALFGGLWLCGTHDAMAPLYGEFVGGLVAIVTVALGGNIAGKWVAGDAVKKNGLSDDPPPTTPAKAPPKAPAPSPPAPRGSAAD